MNSPQFVILDITASLDASSAEAGKCACVWFDIINML